MECLLYAAIAYVVISLVVFAYINYLLRDDETEEE